MTAAEASAAGSLLDLGDDVVQALQLQPTRGALETPVPADPGGDRVIVVLDGKFLPTSGDVLADFRTPVL
jgi:cyanate lyase